MSYRVVEVKESVSKSTGTFTLFTKIFILFTVEVPTTSVPTPNQDEDPDKDPGQYGRTSKPGPGTTVSIW